MRGAIALVLPELSEGVDFPTLGVVLLMIVLGDPRKALNRLKLAPDLSMTAFFEVLDSSFSRSGAAFSADNPEHGASAQPLQAVKAGDGDSEERYEAIRVMKPTSTV